MLSAEPSLLNLPAHVPSNFAPVDAESSLPALPDRIVSYPAHFAAIQDSTEALEAILTFEPPKRSGVELDLNARDSVQWTSLHYAVAYNRPESAAALIRRGARSDIEDGDGKTAVDFALELQTGQEEMLAVLRGKFYFSQ